MVEEVSPQPPNLPPIGAADDPVVQGIPKITPLTVMGALRHQTELIKSLENSMYLAMRPLTNGRFVLPSSPAKLTEKDDGDESIDPAACLEIIQKQTESILALQKSVVSLRPLISNLVTQQRRTVRRATPAPVKASPVPVANHTNIKYKTSVQPNVVRPNNFADACSSILTRARESSKGAGISALVIPTQSNDGEGVNTTDEDIDAIIESRKSKGQWPVKRNTYKQFTNDEELIKVRFHRSQKYPHLPTRIPITESNKEGRLNCRLCSESQGNSRSTSWMCSVCEIPLCIAIMDGHETNEETHHVKFHTKQDLITEHKICNDKLSLVRGEKKERRQNKPSGGGLFDPSNIVVEPTPVCEMNMKDAVV